MTALILFLTFSVYAGPVLQMNRAFDALLELVPFIVSEPDYLEKKNEKIILSQLETLQRSFTVVKHDAHLKEDLFAPSYALLNDNISSSISAFKHGNKEYSLWQLKQITNHCLDCHTRISPEYVSTFEMEGKTIPPAKFPNVYNLGLAQVLTRRYIDAKWSFIRSIQDALITKDFSYVLSPFKQILLIETKIQKNPDNIAAFLRAYVDDRNLPAHVRRTLKAWLERVKFWKNSDFPKEDFRNDKEVDSFIKKYLVPLQKSKDLGEGNEVDLLFASGILSHYLFFHAQSPLAPEINFWLGWIEKYLKREDFYSSGDMFLKQCVRKYPSSPVAKRCLEEYRESVNFDFTGSLGTHVPKEVEAELEELSAWIKKHEGKAN